MIERENEKILTKRDMLVIMRDFNIHSETKAMFVEQEIKFENQGTFEGMLVKKAA